jgi:hypothetical protein
MLLRDDILLNGYGELSCFIPGSLSDRHAKSVLHGMQNRSTHTAVTWL